MVTAQITVEFEGGDQVTDVFGALQWTPSARHLDLAAVVLPTPFRTTLTVSPQVITVPLSEPTWCWKVRELVPGGTLRYVTVTGDAAYSALVDVDPESLEPTAVPPAAWTIAVAALQAGVDAAEAGIAASAASAAAAAISAAEAKVPGPQGEQGVKGDTGAASTVPGPTGPGGAIGATGPASTVAGPIGATGATGPVSTTPGPTGSTGPTGPVDTAGNTAMINAAVPPAATAAVAAAPTVTAAAAAAITAAAVAGNLVTTGTLGPVTLLPEATGYLFTVEDLTGHVAVGVRTDGTTDILKPGMGGVGDGTVTNAKLEPAVAARLLPVQSNDIVCWGDSLTLSWGSTVGFEYPTIVAQLTGRTVRNEGVGGETSAAIAARQGALPWLMLPAGGAIPASGGVVVTFASSGGAETGLLAWPLLQNLQALSGTGVLAGVPGTLTLTQPSGANSAHQASDYYTFTRTTAGVAVPMTRPQPFYTTEGNARRGDIACLWLGRNNMTYNSERAVSDTAACIQNMIGIPRFVVLSVTNNNAEPAGSANYISIASVNAQFLAAYGRRFVDVRRYLIDYGLADAGITPTAQDTIDLGNDVIPSSLRIDPTHLNSAGYTVVGQQVAARLKELGWA